MNFLNEIIHFPFLEQSVIYIWDTKMRTGIWPANSKQPGHTAVLCMLAWIITGGKD